MRLAILSGDARLYSTRRLVEAARARGHVVRVLDPLGCYLRITPGGFQLRCKGRDLAGFDAVIPRFGPAISRYGTLVLRQFELMGAYCLNRSRAVSQTRDKLHSLQLLAAAGLDMPLTVVGDKTEDTDDLLAMLGRPPHVIKLNQGSQGQGVVLAESRAASRSVIEAFRGLHAEFLAQEFVAEAGGSDLRCLVLGGEVIAAMQRRASGDDFRANLHRGGSAGAVQPTAQEIDMAVAATRALGLELAGVDLLRSQRGPLLLEVNVAPGLEGIEAVSGLDLAGRIVAHVARALPVPDSKPAAAPA